MSNISETIKNEVSSKLKFRTLAIANLVRLNVHLRHF